MGQNIYQFTVTRQHQWPEGDLVVEISQGQLDYTNPGALTKKYDGEFETFDGMTPAVKAGIEIAKQWKKDAKKKKQKILIAVGNTGGSTMPFEGEPAIEKTFTALLEKARKFDEKIPKCERCGEIMPPKDQRYGNDFTIGRGPGESHPFCSENCADNDYYEQMKENAVEDEQDEDEEEE